MGDFTQTSAVKTSKRLLAVPFVDMAAFQAVITAIMANPAGLNLTSRVSGGVTIDPVVKKSQRYVAKIPYEDSEAKTVATTTIAAGTSAGFATAIANVLANSALTTAMGGTPSHDSSEDTFTVNVSCSHTNGEVYSLRFTRDAVTLSSYTSDTIKTEVDDWADTITALD